MTRRYQSHFLPYAAGAMLGVSLLLGTPSRAQLGVVGATVLEQGIGGVPDSSNAGDHFGRGLAIGDFNGDGKGDLAIGAASETVSDFVGVGQVTVIYGGTEGPDPTTALTFATEDFGIGAAILDESFGHALATADFDHDGYDDLAVAIPWRSYLVMPGWNTGMVIVVYGSAAGLDTTDFQLFIPGVGGLAGTPDTDDHFGEALATGYFNDDAYADLVVGIPDKDVGMEDDSGAVTVIYGSATGLLATGGAVESQQWTQGSIGLDSDGDGELFGASLAVGDFDDDGLDDLAIGALADEVTGAPAAGSVTVLYGTAMGGLSATGALRVTQSGPTPGNIGANDFFGASLAAADFGCDGIDDLAIGTPGEDLYVEGMIAVESVGAVIVLHGSESGLSTENGFFLDRADATGSYAASDIFGSALTAGDFDGDGCGDLIVGVPGGDPEAVFNAGLVFVFYGVPGAEPVFDVELNQVGALPGLNEVFDHYGSVLATGNLDSDAASDLVVGVPLGDDGGETDTGEVIYYFGSSLLFSDGFESGNTSSWSGGA